ncbi:acyl-CoA dehydrogenase [Kineococcus sp. SYSU DK004]|uniref:acyl-CoA dehydrogenase n=1 Tax=Kineococcus sp. SYSU DK004 TaxID=3383125 RepID=UPI003D7C7D5E
MQPAPNPTAPPDVPADPGGGAAVSDAAHVEAALAAALARSDLPLPGAGRTLARWQELARLAARDLTLARVVEAHTDALAVLAEAGATDLAPPGSTWGVFAAEAAGTRLDARPDGVGGPGGTGWRLSGRKPWCSLAGALSHALVTARTPTGRRLFAVSLRGADVRVVPGAWHARGLRAVASGPVDFDDVAATPVGEDGWYLHRPGFAHGGAGVAACWYGGASAVAAALGRSLTAPGGREPDQVARWHAGENDLDLWRSRLALEHAAAEVDAGRAAGAAGARLALRTRSVVAAAAEAVLARTGHALGPAPLTLDAEHAARVADLTVYLRQHHAERDVAALGGDLADPAQDGSGWPR